MLNRSLDPPRTTRLSKWMAKRWAYCSVASLEKKSIGTLVVHFRVLLVEQFHRLSRKSIQADLFILVEMTCWHLLPWHETIQKSISQSMCLIWLIDFSPDTKRWSKVLCLCLKKRSVCKVLLPALA